MPERTPHGALVPLWAKVALPLVVLTAALVIGSGVFDRAPQTPSQRAAAIESGVRCPSCTDLSVAESDASTAIAVRHQIESMVADGRSTTDIDQELVSEYGPAILLVPPDAGGVPLIWIIPLVLGLGTLATVGVVFWRRSRAFDALRTLGAEEIAAPGTAGPREHEPVQ
jgi:cytochrome c-type biogenesis protein CcmH/NrfF